MADDIHGGSLSDYNTSVFEKAQESFKREITNPVSNAYTNITNTDWSEVASNTASNIYGAGGDFVNNALDNISSNIDSALKTGKANLGNLADNAVGKITGKISDKINNKFNSTFGKIEAKLRKGLLGKLDSWFGNPIMNSYKSIFGGLPGKLGSQLRGSFRNNPWINFYIDGNNYVNAPGQNGGTGGNQYKDYGDIEAQTAASKGWATSRRTSGGSVDSPNPYATGWNNRNTNVGNGRSTGSVGRGYNSYTGIPQRQDINPAAINEDLSLFSTAAFKNIAERIKNTYGFTNNINEGMHLERTFVNRFGVTLIDNTLAHTRTHIFIGKPTCNILTKDCLIPEDLGKKDSDLAMLINQDKDLYTQLNARIPGMTPFMTALQNRIVGISFQDATLSKAESAANIRGIRQEYPLFYADSLVNVPITLTFAMDRNAEAFKLINVWVTYMEKVKEGTLAQDEWDTIYNRMSYTVPIYVFVTEENNHDIVFWAKLVGNYPLTIPFSVFSNQGIINREVKEISVSFNSSMFKPFDAYALMEFNEMQKSQTKNYWLDYVPVAERKLEYYWTTGATVTLNDDTGKFRLNYYTSSSTTVLGSGGGSGRSYVNGMNVNNASAAAKYAQSLVNNVRSRLRF